MPASLQRIAHARGSAPSPSSRRRGDVVRVGAHAVADQLAVDLRAARLRVLVLLEHQRAGALAEHEAVAVLVPRPARAGRIVVARGQRARRGKAADRRARSPSLPTPPAIMTSASPYRIDFAASPMQWVDVVQAVTMARFGPFAPELDRQQPRDHVDDAARDEERRDAPRAVRLELVVHRFDQRQAADARAEVDADALRVLRRDLERRTRARPAAQRPCRTG